MKKIIFLLIPILLTISIIEFILYQIKPNYTELDNILGWNLKKNFQHTYKQKNFKGKKYNVNFSTNYLHMRNHFTNTNENNDINFLVFGDSFTSDPYASNDKMWFSKIANLIYEKKGKHAAAYSIGAGGYGSLQQLLSLKKIKKEGFDFNKINFFIFQFCNNDFDNNSLEIEKKSRNFNQYSRRPYLVNDQIIYDQSIISKILRFPVLGESRILNKFFFLLSKINLKNSEKTNYKKSIQTTKKIISKIRSELNNKTTIFINCENNNKWEDVILQIVEENNFIYVKFPEDIKKSKENLFEDGSHLSERGNIFLGDYLFNILSKNKIF